MTKSSLEDTPICVELLELDKITHSTLSYFFKSNLCVQAKISDSSVHTNVYIMDQHTKTTPHFFKTIHIRNRYAIVLYMDEIQLPKNPNVFLLQKPINAQKLMLIIKQIYQLIQKTAKNKPIKGKQDNIQKNTETNDMDHLHLYHAISKEKVNDIHLRYKAQKYVGSNKDFSPEQLATEKIFITPEKYLFHQLIRAKKLAQQYKKNTLISSYSGDIYYHYSLNLFLHNIDEKKLKLMQTAPLSNNFQVSIFNKMNKTLYNSLEVTQASAFIWESTIQASKGRIPHHTNIHNIVTMKAWPNFSRLQIFRYAIQISALWSRQELSLYDTAIYLKIPQRYVFTLYCAMHALACVSTEKNSSHKSVNTDRNESSPSIFSKLLTHIFKT